MNLIEWLPSYYKKSQEVNNLQESISIENEKLKKYLEEVTKQFFVDTATWGIDYWERQLALQVDPKESLDIRKARIKTRLRGTGTTSIEMIKNVCKSFVNGKVAIIENQDYSFIIKFTDVKGIPSNIEYLRTSIEKIKPAHLNFSFQYLYNTWGNLKNLSWKQIKTSTWEQVKTREVI